MICCISKLILKVWELQSVHETFQVTYLVLLNFEAKRLRDKKRYCALSSAGRDFSGLQCEGVWVIQFSGLHEFHLRFKWQLLCWASSSKVIEAVAMKDFQQISVGFNKHCHLPYFHLLWGNIFVSYLILTLCSSWYRATQRTLKRPEGMVRTSPNPRLPDFQTSRRFLSCDVW